MKTYLKVFMWVAAIIASIYGVNLSLSLMSSPSDILLIAGIFLMVTIVTTWGQIIARKLG